MQRRELIAAVAASSLAGWLPARAQQTGGVLRLGVLRPTARPPAGDDPLAMSLRQLGYVEGGNLIIEARYAENDVARLPLLARELMDKGVHLVLAVGASAARAVRATAPDIPMVVYGNFDPVAAGLTSNLARPGRNTTGILIAPEGTLAGKKLELLREAVPNADRVAFLAPDRRDPASIDLQIAEVSKAAAALGVQLPIIESRDGDYDAAFNAITATGARAVFVAATSYFMIDRQRIISLTLRHRLPSIWEWADQVRDGGLMSYGSSRSVINGRIASHIDRIFRGTNAGDLPFEQPTTFEFVVNLGTAKALGLTLPPPLLARADEVIE